MPQLVKGGKWVFGWVIVQSDRTITIPPEPWKEYGFEVGEEALLIRGSRTSGGFSLATPRLIAGTAISLGGEQRILGRGRIEPPGCVTLPDQIEVLPGQRLLAVRGSGRALGFLQKGRIFEEAQKHPEIEVFER
jgi:hypothetical protein